MNLVVIGCGRYAKATHIPYIKSSKHAKLVGTADPDPYLDINQFDTPHLSDVEHLEAFLDDVNADGVIISTPPRKRENVYDAVLNKPLHIHVDKPLLAPNQSDTAFIDAYTRYADRLKKHQFPVSIHSQRRFDPHIIQCKENIRSLHNQTGVKPHRIQYDGFDGNFRTNREWSQSQYHSVNQPLGIITHSYYHYIDTVSFLLEPLEIRETSTEVNVLTLSDVARQNCLVENALLQTTSTESCDGPIELESTHTFRTQDDHKIRATITISHQGVTRRSDTVTNQYVDNRYSQKHLSIHAASLLSASYESRPKNLSQPQTKVDYLRIDNALDHRTITSQQQRDTKPDEKRRKCLEAFLKGYTEGTGNPSGINRHELTQKLYLDTVKAVNQANPRFCL